RFGREFPDTNHPGQPNSMRRRGKLLESCFDSHSPTPGTCVRLQGSNSISHLYLISRSGRENYYSQEKFIDQAGVQSLKLKVGPEAPAGPTGVQSSKSGAAEKLIVV